MSLKENRPSYGLDDASYQAAGGLDGITQLVDAFYSYMDKLPEASEIRAMHPNDLTISKDKLTCFLSGWLGGPRLFSKKYGSISIPMIHKHLSVDSAARDAWLLCMRGAANDQPYSNSFKRYLLEQLFVPAERVRQVSRKITTHR